MTDTHDALAQACRHMRAAMDAVMAREAADVVSVTLRRLVRRALRDVMVAEVLARALLNPEAKEATK